MVLGEVSVVASVLNVILAILVVVLMVLVGSTPTAGFMAMPRLIVALPGAYVADFITLLTPGIVSIPGDAVAIFVASYVIFNLANDTTLLPGSIITSKITASPTVFLIGLLEDDV